MSPGKELVIAIMNAGTEATPVELNIQAPGKTQFAALNVASSKLDGGKPAIQSDVVKLASPSGTHPLSRTLAPGQVVVVSAKLIGDVDADGPSTVTRTQFFGEAIVENVTGDKAVDQAITLDGTDLGQVERAWVRFVTERLAQGEGVLTLNGARIELPGAVTPENTAFVVDVPIDPSLLKKDNTLTFATDTPHRAGYLLGKCSVIVETK